MNAPACELGVIGAGSYGTALAVVTAANGRAVCLYGHEPDHIARLEAARVNEQFLPGVSLPENLRLTSHLDEVCACPALLVVVPSHAFREVLTNMASLLRPGYHRVFWATKGLDPQSGRLLSEIAEETLPPGIPLAAISGPTFAMELARGLPTAIAVAGNDPEFTRYISVLMHTPRFRIYENDDFIALQLGGTVKNVIAIGCGLSDGMGYGANARTALMSRGLAEMIRFGLAYGATEHGFNGLSGLGDLIMTCTDNQSRNRRFGCMLGRGVGVQQALDEIGQVVEGYSMAAVLHTLTQKKNVQMPICDEIYAVLYEGKDSHAAARDLLSREQTAE